MNKKIKKYLSKLGKKGGKKTALRGKRYYSKIGKEGAKKKKLRKIEAMEMKNYRRKIKVASTPASLGRTN